MITLMGYVIIPISIFAVILNKKYFLKLILILCGFTGSSIFVSNKFQITVPHFFCLLLLLYALFTCLKYKKIKFNIPSKYFMLFFCWCFLSSFVPIFIDESILVLGVDNNIKYLEYSLTNITQLIYLFMNCVIYIYIYNTVTSKECNVESINKLIDDYAKGIVLVCLICIYQIIAFKYNLPFDYIFRETVLGNIQGDRIYGPCNEASTLAYYLITGLPILYRCRFSNILKITTFLLCIFVGIFSYSSTFIVGLLLWPVLEFIFKLKLIDKFTLKRRRILQVVSFFTIIVFILTLYNEEILFYYDKAVSKLLDTVYISNQSGRERWNSFALLFDVALQHPIIGIGFGSSRGYDLFSTWLANIGFVGMIILSIFLSSILNRDIKSYYFLKIPIVLVWISMFISVPEPYSLFAWLFLAIVDALSNKNLKNVI